MPTIDIFNGIKICIYNGDHRPPHIHAQYNEFEVLIQIEDGVIYAGDLPNKQMNHPEAEPRGIKIDFFLSDPEGRGIKPLYY